MKIGVLALQGDFVEHIKILNKLGIKTSEVRNTDDLITLDGLIIPGGESTTITRLIKKYGFDIALKNMPNLFIFGSCAGAIVLSKKIINDRQESLDLLNISIKRNAYGRQLESFETDIKIADFKEKFNSIFIRAPKIKNIGNNIEVLAQYNNDPVLVRNGKILVSTFHPELTSDTRIHKYFVDMIKYK